MESGPGLEQPRRRVSRRWARLQLDGAGSRHRRGAGTRWSGRAGNKRIARGGLKAHARPIPRRLRSLIREHILSVGTAMRGQVIDWDVVNEPFVNNDLMKILGEERAGRSGSRFAARGGFRRRSYNLQ